MLSIIQFLNTLAKSSPVDLLCLDSEESISNYLENNIGTQLNKELNIIKIENHGFGIKSNKVFFFQNISKYINSFKSEKIVIYTRDIKQMRLCIKKLKKSNQNIKFIFEVHQILSTNLLQENKNKQSLKIKQIEDFVFSNADGLVCITKTLSEELSRLFQNCCKNQLILPVGFSNRFLSLEERETKKYDILYCGNFSPWKGVDDLLEAISIIKNEKFKNISAILIGANNDSQSYYESRSEKLGITKNIKIIKRIEHFKVSKFLIDSKIGVVPTTSKGDGLLYTSPLKLFEYLGGGMKVVAARLPSIESIVDNQIVYFSNPDDPKSLAMTLIHALEDQNFNSQEVKNFAKKYTWEVRAEKFLDFIS